MSWDVGQRFSDAEKKLMWQMHADGESNARIAKAVGRKTASVATWIKNRSTGLECIEKPTKHTRPCMCCGRQFLSKGPHNRLCLSCKQIETTPFDFLGDRK